MLRVRRVSPVGCLYSIGGAGGECPSREKPLETNACVQSTGPQQSRQRSTAGERKTAAFQSPIEFWHPTASGPAVRVEEARSQAPSNARGAGRARRARAHAEAPSRPARRSPQTTSRIASGAGYGLLMTCPPLPRGAVAIRRARRVFGTYTPHTGA